MTTDTTQKVQDETPNPEDATQKGGEPSLGQKEPSPEETPQTYTKEELDRALQLDRMKAGRDWKALETERDNLKKQLENKTSEVTEISTEIENLKKQIDELASDDPEKVNLVKKLREAEEEKKQAKAERTALESDKQAHQEKVTLAENTLREISIWEISTEYEGGNPVKLKELCDLFQATSEEQIRQAADTLWGKEADKSATPPVKSYSGITSGGTEFTRDSGNPDATLTHGFRKLKK